MAARGQKKIHRVSSLDRAVEVSPVLPMRRKMIVRLVCLFLILWFFNLSCGRNAQPSSQQANTAVAVISPQADKAWDEVLHIAKSRSPEAHAKLSKIASQGQRAPSNKLASVILYNWNERDNTFYSERPLLVVDGIKDLRILQGVTLVEIRADVDPRGIVTKAKFLTPLDNPQKNDVLLRAIRATLYCPAKPKDTYVPASVTYMINTEIQ
jgi:hypothetical protein